MLEILRKVALTLTFLGISLSLVSLPLLIALQDSDVSSGLILGGVFTMMMYPAILLLFGLSLGGLLGTFGGRLIFIEKLILSIAVFSLGLMLASPLSLLLFIFLQPDIVQMIGIGILVIGGFSLLIAFLLGMTYVLVNVWQDRLW